MESNNVELWTFLQEVLFHVHFLIISLLVPIGIWLFAGLPLKVFAHVIGLCIIKLQFLSSNTTMDLLKELIYCKKILFCPYKIYLTLLMYFIWMWWLLCTVLSSKDFLKAFCRHALIGEFLVGTRAPGCQGDVASIKHPHGNSSGLPKKLNSHYLTTDSLWGSFHGMQFSQSHHPTAVFKIFPGSAKHLKNKTCKCLQS